MAIQPQNRILGHGMITGDKEEARRRCHRYWLSGEDGALGVSTSASSTATAWDVLLALAPVIGRRLCDDGLQSAVEGMWCRCPGWGGTLLQVKTPARWVARVLLRNGVLVHDYAMWAPPGPGARECLNMLHSTGSPAEDLRFRHPAAVVHSRPLRKTI